MLSSSMRDIRGVKSAEEGWTPYNLMRIHSECEMPIGEH